MKPTSAIPSPAGPAPILVPVITAGIVVALSAAPLFASVPFASEVGIQGAAGASDVLAADLDGDGVPDVVGVATGRVLYVLNSGDATSWTGVNLTTGASRPRQLAVADLDGDTRDDIVYTDFTEGKVYWFSNDLESSGSFSARRTAASLDGADGVTAHDFDGDSDIDLLVAARAADT